MSDIGVVGTGRIRIEPDFTGFAATFRSRIQPIIKQASLGITDIDKALASATQSATKLAAPLQKSATASVKLAESLRTVAAIDLDDASNSLSLALERATPAATELATQMRAVRSGFTGAATGAANLDTALAGIDTADLTNVVASAEAASASLEGMALAAVETDVALASIDATDLRVVTAQASQASAALTSTAAAGAAASGATTGAFGKIEGSAHALRNTLIATAVGFGGVVIGSGLAIKASLDFESAFTGVTKTVEGTEEQLAVLRQGIIDMSTTLPASTTEIAAIAEEAGALGVATPAVLDFTRVMIDLGNTTNLSADQAADAFARIANITQLPQDQFDNMGSTVVDLGNKLATTEAEITEMSLRIAGAGHTIGLTDAQILSFAAALSSVGINAEAGGSAISRTFIDMATAVNSGGETLGTFARVAGMDVANFAYLFKTDAAGATLAFIQGLSKMQAAGGDVFGVLEELGITEIRQRDALLRAAGAGDLFTKSLQIGSQAWQENTALANEANKRYATTASQLEVLKNQALDTARQVGDSLMPAFTDAAKSLSGSLVPAIASMTETAGPAFSQVIAALGTAFAPIVAALGPVLAALGGQLTPIIESLTPHLAEFANIVGGSLIMVLEQLGPLFLTLVTAAGPLLPILAELAASVLTALTPVLVALIEAGLVPLIEGFTNLLEPLTENQTAMTLLAAAVGLAGAAFAAFQIGSFITAFAPLAAALGSAVAGFTSLNAIVLFVQGAIGAVLGPVVLVVAAIAALGAAAYVAYQHIEPFHDAVDTVGRFIRDTAIGAFERLSDIIGNTLVPWLQQLADVARSTFQENIQPALEDLVGAFSELWNALVGVGQPILQWLIDHWQLVAGVILAVVAPMAAVVAGAVALYANFEPVRDIVNRVVGVVADLVTALVELAGPIIGNVIDAVRGLIDIVTGLFSWDIDKIKAGIVTLAEGILGVMRSAFVELPKIVWNALSALGPILLDVLTGLGGLLVQGLTAAWDWVVANGPGILMAVTTWLLGLPGTLLGLLGDLGSLLVGWWMTAMEFVVNSMGTIWSGLFDFIASIPQRLLDGLAVGISFVFDFVELAFMWLVDNGPSLFAHLVEFFTGIPGTILGWLSSFQGMLVSWITGAFDWLVQNGPGILAAVNEWVSSLPGKFIGLLGDIGTTLFDWLKAGFGYVVEKGPELIAGVIDFFTGLPGRIFDAIKSGLGSAAQGVTDIATSLYNSIVDFLNERLLMPIKGFTIDLFGPRTPFDALPLLNYAHSGGIIGKDVTGPTGFPGLKPDEVPVIMQTGEGVLPRDVMDRLGAQGFASIMAGQFAGLTGAGAATLPGAGLIQGGGSVTVNVYPTYDASITEADAKNLGESEGNAIVDVLRARAMIAAS